MRTLRSRPFALACGAAGAIVLALTAWAIVTFVAAPWPAQQTTVLIPQGSGVSAIAARLHQQGVLRFPAAFRLLVRVRGVEARLHAGQYAF
ncbi:MAG: hypothetical protein KGM44_00665, partial [bacterium]|nr:hypothetical protein [bacterium]